MTSATTNDTQNITDAKHAMRERIKQLREALSDAARHEETSACYRHLLALSAYQEAKTVLTYMSFGSEMGTYAFLQTLFDDKKNVIAPRIVKRPGGEKHLVLQGVQNVNDLEKGQWGILQPRLDMPVVNIADVDFALVPGLAFDERGGRLGYGAGYYDGLLAKASPAMLRVSVAFFCQVVERVPVAANDLPIDILITASGGKLFNNDIRTTCPRP